MTVHVAEYSGRSRPVRIGLNLYTNLNYTKLLHMGYTYKIKQCLSPMMAYSFISYSDIIYEITVHASDCTGGKAVGIGFSLYTYNIMQIYYA